MAFNDRLKESRTNAGLTQEQLSEKLGIAKSTLSGYETEIENLQLLLLLKY